jgi:DNA-binding transcriptional regulator YiaG
MMPNNTVYHSKVRAIVHETMRNLYDVGLIDQDAMRTFDELCLTHATAEDRVKMRRNGAASPQANYFAASPAE